MKEKGEKERENKKEKENGGKEKEIGKQKERAAATPPTTTSTQNQTDGKSPLATRAPPPNRLNGHAPQSPVHQENGVEAGSVGVVSGGRPASPAMTTPIQSPTPSSPASSSLSSSPCSSPILSKRTSHSHTPPFSPPPLKGLKGPH